MNTLSSNEITLPRIEEYLHNRNHSIQLPPPPPPNTIPILVMIPSNNNIPTTPNGKQIPIASQQKIFFDSQQQLVPTSPLGNVFIPSGSSHYLNYNVVPIPNENTSMFYQGSTPPVSASNMALINNSNNSPTFQNQSFSVPTPIEQYSIPLPPLATTTNINKTVNESSKSLSPSNNIHNCSQKIERSSRLKRNLLKHSSERPFGCPWCKSRHKRRDNLFKHMKLKHMKLLMKAIQDYYPLADFQNKDMKVLMKDGQLHREDVRTVFFHLIGLEA